MSGTEGKSKAGAIAKANTKPPAFKEDPTGAYEYLQKAYEELIGSRDRVKEQNKALRSMGAGQRADEEEAEIQAGLAILSMASGEAPPCYGTKGGHSAQIWITSLEKLQGDQRWSDKQTLDAAELTLFGIAAEWKAAQMEANTEVFQNLKLFKAAFVKRFAIQQSSVESIKLVMELKQKSDEKVRDFYDRVFKVIMYFGRERKLEMTAANQEDGFKHYYLCLTDFVKLLFIGGTKPVNRTVLESKYNSLICEESLLDAAVEAEVATSAPVALADGRISQLEAEIAALRICIKMQKTNLWAALSTTASQ